MVKSLYILALVFLALILSAFAGTECNTTDDCTGDKFCSYGFCLSESRDIAESFGNWTEESGNFTSETSKMLIAFGVMGIFIIGAIVLSNNVVITILVGVSSFICVTLFGLIPMWVLVIFIMIVAGMVAILFMKKD